VWSNKVTVARWGQSLLAFPTVQSRNVAKQFRYFSLFLQLRDETSFWQEKWSFFIAFH
jgi:hypothetical protein